MNEEIYDLRTALSLLNSSDEEIEIVERELSPVREIPSHYAAHGAGVPNAGNLKHGSPVIYSNVKGHSMPVLMGLFNSRAACAKMLGMDCEGVGKELSEYVVEGFQPVMVENPPCQENVITRDIDITDILPVLTYTKDNAGPYITTGIVYASDPETGEEDITIHRLCVQGKDTLTAYLIQGRHIEIFYRKAAAMGKPLPITINIGVDPAIMLASTFSYPVTPLGFNELNIAGAVRKEGVRVSKAVTNEAKCIAYSEIVLEGYIMPQEMHENANCPEGHSLPEFLGYIGKAQKSLPVVKVTAVTYRNNPIYQTIVGPGAELSHICGIATEASIYKCVKDSVTSKVLNCCCSHCGGGKLTAFLQFRKDSEIDDAKTRQAGIAAFTAFHELKHVYLVDEDVNILDERDVLWAMTTRFQGTHSMISIPNLNCHVLDPSQSPEFSRDNSVRGTTYKTVFDCTVPFNMKNQFRRVDYGW
ncbi:4-hydroxy-3-polyprenylbenzoate decarboxylase [Ruminiclostridium sufflavum DSM 19573]|uniref:4-hydroxy-3-polyprenylbenzoate decarboxylase n=1 Tax=Ruminiclostridium sufflavum DSM 19573 TaxID=1121337 RepID=A0A318XTQ7_9FIRM|nr:UbiD family decarboxylase [Ruminiclostridium sufflavum]PYG90233.1 4-hydroxy-3-polyprenylbenzoate decarboxylase [Ruminiclostridium sufflavum DSM 19573]